MAFFPRTLYGSSDASFTPLFRLLEDFDQYSRQGQGRQHRSHVPTFQPKFDVREVEDAYELHGELAGLNKNDVSIEFTDPHTLHIRGRVARSYTSGTPPAALLDDTKMSGAITENGEQEEATTPKSSHQASVEEAADDESTASTTAEATPATTVAEVAQETSEKKNADKAKYWVSERSIGEFSRTFNFPGQIQQDAVTASLKDGVLNVRVPKAPKHEIRRVSIN